MSNVAAAASSLANAIGIWGMQNRAESQLRKRENMSAEQEAYSRRQDAIKNDREERKLVLAERRQAEVERRNKANEEHRKEKLEADKDKAETTAENAQDKLELDTRKQEFKEEQADIKNRQATDKEERMRTERHEANERAKERNALKGRELTLKEKESPIRMAGVQSSTRKRDVQTQLLQQKLQAAQAAGMTAVGTYQNTVAQHMDQINARARLFAMARGEGNFFENEESGLSSGYANVPKFDAPIKNYFDEEEG